MGVAQVCQPHFNMIGLFKRPQTNRQDNEKGMQFGCQQPLLLGERCVTPQKTAARETSVQVVSPNVVKYA